MQKIVGVGEALEMILGLRLHVLRARFTGLSSTLRIGAMEKRASTATKLNGMLVVGTPNDKCGEFNHSTKAPVRFETVGFFRGGWGKRWITAG